MSPFRKTLAASAGIALLAAAATIPSRSASTDSSSAAARTEAPSGASGNSPGASDSIPHLDRQPGAEPVAGHGDTQSLVSRPAVPGMALPDIAPRSTPVDPVSAAFDPSPTIGAGGHPSATASPSSVPVGTLSPGGSVPASSAPTLPPGGPAATATGSEHATVDSGRASVDPAVAQSTAVYLDTNRVSLAAGHILSVDEGSIDLDDPAAADTYDDSDTAFNDSDMAFWMSYARTSDVAITFTYRIDMLGMSSDYWMVGHIETDNDGSIDDDDTTCKIYHSGPPDTPGSVDTGDDRIEGYGPFTCDPPNDDDIQTTDNLTFTVGLRVDHGIYGSVSTEHTYIDRRDHNAVVTKMPSNLSLDSGYYEHLLPYQIDGAPTVGIEGSTPFTTIQREGDTVLQDHKGELHHAKARTVFAYRIVDDGVPTDFWVRGDASYDGDLDTDACDIYYGSPVPVGGNPATGVKTNLAPYGCTFTHFHSGVSGIENIDFHVFKNPITVLPPDANTEEQRTTLVQTYCTNPDEDAEPDAPYESPNCSLLLSDVHQVDGPIDQYASPIVHNNTSSPVQQELVAVTSTTVTNTVGVSITTTIGGQDLFGMFKWSVSVTTSYSYSISRTQEYRQSASLSIAPGKSGWFAMAPSMIHAEGSVIVKDKGGTLYLLPGISADFPDASGRNILVAEEQ